MLGRGRLRGRPRDGGSGMGFTAGTTQGAKIEVLLLVTST